MSPSLPSPLAPPVPTQLQREIAAHPSRWFVQSPLCVAAGLALLRYGFRVPWRSARGRRVLQSGAFALLVMGPFDVWYWRRARAAVADRDGWEMRQRRRADPVEAPRGVRGPDGEWTTAETTTTTTTTVGGGISDYDGSSSSSGGDDNVTTATGRFGGSGGGGKGEGGDGTRSQGGYAGAGGDGGDEELKDPWALPQSKKGGSSRWS